MVENMVVCKNAVDVGILRTTDGEGGFRILRAGVGVLILVLILECWMCLMSLMRCLCNRLTAKFGSQPRT